MKRFLAATLVFAVSAAPLNAQQPAQQLAAPAPAASPANKGEMLLTFSSSTISRKRSTRSTSN
jgi:hypothetical protein